MTSEDKSAGILKAAWMIALVTIVSKLIGFVRDVVIANYYGTSLVSDAYFYAYQIPALSIILLGGVGGPFHSATVAIFSKLIPDLKDKPTDELNKLYSTFMTTTIILFTVLAVLCYFFAPQIMGVIASGGDPELINLAAEHLQIMSPVLVIGGIVGIYYGLLVTYRYFMLPNVSPIIMSLVIIIMVMTSGKNDHAGITLALATTIGAICQWIVQFPKIRQLGYRLKPNLDVTHNKNFQNICELLFPAVLSSTVGQIHIYVDMFFASSLREGAWTAIGYANRVFQFPVGILVTAFLVPLFPIFSRLVMEKDYEGIKNYFNKGVGVLFFGAIPIIIGILVLGIDGISLIFERGAFDAKATFMVAEALWFLSVSILPYVFRDSITRVYYSFNDSKTPFVVAFTSIVLKVFLNILFINILGMSIGGITLSTSLVTLFNACVLGTLIGRKIKLNYGELFKNLLKMIAAGGITLVICAVCALLMDKFTPFMPKALYQILKICVIGFICLAVYTGLNLALKMDYAKELFNRLKR